ncbi:hypothetical protein IWQ62_001170 [Dispira parvispora]|uniref:Uncharacterized protein n=1 Tax=Dispira parvispora TaxID=1520584 RepID=A0A9W8E470_9FUNG|nr:hypothetical protein IWQ62_001170 [Dispira parvispora]
MATSLSAWSPSRWLQHALPNVRRFLIRHGTFRRIFAVWLVLVSLGTLGLVVREHILARLRFFRTMFKLYQSCLVKHRTTLATFVDSSQPTVMHHPLPSEADAKLTPAIDTWNTTPLLESTEQVLRSVSELTDILNNKWKLSRSPQDYSLLTFKRATRQTHSDVVSASGQIPSSSLYTGGAHGYLSNYGSEDVTVRMLSELRTVRGLLLSPKIQLD